MHLLYSECTRWLNLKRQTGNYPNNLENGHIVIGYVCRGKLSRPSVWSVLFSVRDAAVETAVVSRSPPCPVVVHIHRCGRDGWHVGTDWLSPKDMQTCRSGLRCRCVPQPRETALLLSTLPPAPVPGHVTQSQRCASSARPLQRSVRGEWANATHKRWTVSTGTFCSSGGRSPAEVKEWQIRTKKNEGKCIPVASSSSLI